MKGLNWSEEELEAYMRTKFPAARQDRAAVSPADVEPNSKHEPAPADAAKKAHPRFRIHVHSRRRRLTDPDGISVKAAIDGLVRGGLLADDGPQVVEEITFSQEKCQYEETVIEIYEVCDERD